ncbi:MAG: ABC transporter ATP-binding protein [Pacificimonas sp.]
MSLKIENLVRAHLPGPVSATIAKGSLCALCGPNGAGKTTLLRAIAGLTEGVGKVSLFGKNVRQLSRAERARRIAYLPADRRAQWPLKVRDVIALGLQSHDEEAVATAMEKTETTYFSDRRIDTLSTGERARVLLARTLVGSTDILLLDEPAANLDPGHQLDIMHLLRAETGRGAIVLVSLHDLTLARASANSCLLIDQGRQISFGSAHETLSNTNLARIFGVIPGENGWQRA